MYKFQLFLRTVSKFTKDWQPWLWSEEQEICIINEQHCQLHIAALIRKTPNITEDGRLILYAALQLSLPDMYSISVFLP